MYIKWALVIMYRIKNKIKKSVFANRSSITSPATAKRNSKVRDCPEPKAGAGYVEEREGNKILKN